MGLAKEVVMIDILGVGALILVELVVFWLIVRDPDVNSVLFGSLFFLPWLFAAALGLWRGLDAGFRLGPLCLAAAVAIAVVCLMSGGRPLLMFYGAGGASMPRRILAWSGVVVGASLGAWILLTMA